MHFIRGANRAVETVAPAICLAALCALCLLVAARTIQWPLAGDAALIHYAVFLLDSGRGPYEQVRDINLPGAYLADWLLMHLLGAGALADRLYDYALSTGSLFAAWWIARGVCDRSAHISKSRPIRLGHSRSLRAGRGVPAAVAIFAAAMFFLLHAKDGIVQTGQRDWTLTVLVLFAVAAWLHAARSGWARWHIVAGILVACAAAIKPVAVLFAVPLLVERIWVSRDRYAAAARPCLLLALGIVLPLAGCAAWLAHERALSAFFSAGIPMMRYHASLHRETMMALARHGLSGIHVPLLLAALLLPVAWPLLRSSEFALLCAQAAVGYICYAMQGKGYAYQRYPFLFFALMVIGFILIAALSSEKMWARRATCASLCVCCLWVAPQAAARALRYKADPDPFGAMLRGDLEALGGAQLDGKVQCLDTFSGCIRVLYEMRLQQSTGTMYDEFLFGGGGNPVIASNREAFVADLEKQPPEVFIVTPQNYSGVADGYDKVDSWPWFAAYLAEGYRLCAERTPKAPQLWEGDPRVPLGYRLYVQKDFPCAVAAG